MFRIYLLLAFILVLTIGCKKDEVKNINSNIQFSTFSNGKKININDSTTLYDGTPYKITALKYYISNIRFVNHQGEDIPFKISEKTLGSEQGVLLYELGKNEATSGSIAENHYTKIKFDIGLDNALNNLDPNQFPSAHPLSRSHDMFWDMTKYRFIVFEGSTDTSQTGLFNFPFSYHIGGKDFLKNVELNIDWNVKSDPTNNLSIVFNIDKVFTNGTHHIDMKTFFSYHSTDDQKEIGMKMMDNISKSFE